MLLVIILLVISVFVCLVFKVVMRWFLLFSILLIFESRINFVFRVFVIVIVVWLVLMFIICFCVVRLIELMMGIVLVVKIVCSKVEFFGVVLLIVFSLGFNFLMWYKLLFVSDKFMVLMLFLIVWFCSILLVVFVRVLVMIGIWLYGVMCKLFFLIDLSCSFVIKLLIR